MEFGSWVSSVVLGAVTIGTLAVMARRVLGVPVGWVRAVAVGVVVMVTGQGFMTLVAARAGLLSLDSDRPGDATAVVIVLALAVAWAFTIGLLLLVAAELLVPSGSLPPASRLVVGWGARRRRARRYLRIMLIVFRRGLGRFLRLRRDAALSGSERARTARSLRLALEDGGVTFVKLGQTLATRSDLLPPEYVTELSRLHAAVEAAPWPRIEAALVTSLGRPVAEVFTWVDPEPLAAASVGQVHRARLLDGRDVVVKVQRPDAAAQIAADLDILGRLADRLERNTAWGRSLGVESLAAGFADSLTEELDYRVELANTLAVEAGLRTDSPITVPQTFPELSSQRLLVMAEVRGVPLTRARAELAAMPAQRRVELASGVLGEVLHQLLVSGVFHADLHPGNLVLRDDGSLVLLDFGSVGRLDDVSRGTLGMPLAAVDGEDSVTATDALVELLGRPDDLDERALERELGSLLLRVGGGSHSLGAGGPFAELMQLVLRHRFAVPTQVAAAFRALATLEGTLAVVAPDLDIVAGAPEQARSLLSDRFTPQHIRDTLRRQAAANLPIAQRLPRRVDKILGQVEDGRLSLSVRLLADPRDRAFVTDLANHAMLTVLAATATIGAILLLIDGGGPEFAPHVQLYDVLGYLLLFFGFVLALRVLVGVFFGPRRP